MNVMLHLGSSSMSSLLASVGVRSEVQLTTPPIGYVGVELGGCEVGVAEHLLDGAQVGSPLEEVRGERVAQQVRVHARRLEPGGRGEAAQDQEGAGAGQAAALRVEKQLGSMALVEVGPATGEVAAQRLDGFAADRHDPLLRALAEA